MKRVHRRNFRQLFSMQPLVRAIMVISSVTVLATGVTFAALQSQQAALTGNSIQSATANLQIGTSTASFAASRVGYEFKEVIPGTAATPADGNSFYLKNSGTSSLALKVSVSSTPVNSGNVDLSKVRMVFTRVDTGAATKIDLATLISSNTSGGSSLGNTLAGGSTIAHYKMQIEMDTDAFSGTSAKVEGIDLVFVGTAVVQ